MREDLENLNFNELTELEKKEYVAVLTYNLKRLCLQLMNCGDTQLAGLFQLITNLAMASPDKFNALSQYAYKLHETWVVEQEIHRRANAMVETPEQTEPQDNFPPLDSDKEQ
jgi:hypothetical protein